MDIYELVSSVELRDVVCLQLTADRGADDRVGVADISGEPVEPDLGLEVQPVAWGDRVEIWFRASVETANATLSAAYAVIYDRRSETEIPEAVRIEFVERVAVMVVVPYLREALQSLGARMRIPAPLLPILRQGEFRLTERGDAPAPAEDG